MRGCVAPTFGAAHHLQSVGVNDVEVTDDIGTVSVFLDETDATVTADAADPVQCQTLLVLVIELGDAEFFHDQ